MSTFRGKGMGVVSLKTPPRKRFRNYILIVLTASFILPIASASVEEIQDYFTSAFYAEKRVYRHDFTCQSVQFDNSPKINCACVSGLWFLYSSCNEHEVIATEEHHCLDLPGKEVVRAVQLARDRLELSVLNIDGTIQSIESGNDEDITTDQGVVLITGSEWTLIEKNSGKRTCLTFQKEDSYCFYSGVPSFSAESGCEEFDDFLEPLKCESIRKSNQRSCEETGITNTDTGHHSIKKRQVPPGPPAPPPAGEPPAPAPSPTGGASPPAGGEADTGMALNETMIVPEDEDYHLLNPNGTNTTGAQNRSEASISIVEGLLEFMDLKLDILLGLDKFKDVSSDARTVPVQSAAQPYSSLNVTYANPVYEYLEISKRITQKTCPAFYVQPEFLNLAVATFIRMHQVNFKFPEIAFKPSGFRRVLSVLRQCEEEAVPFNFTDADCDGKVDGKYTAFGEIMEMTVSSEYVNLKRDPIVETVWKIFYNVHSYCFPFFNHTLDHHRFTTWMIPLFQNQMNDLWVNGETTETSLNGLFGNQVELQGNLAYCAVSSRLESEYPWDLVRPLGVPEYGSLTNATGNGTSPDASGGGAAPPPPEGGAAPPTGGGTPPAPPPAGRRKRGINEIDVVSFRQEAEDSTCSGRSVLCPQHVITLGSLY